MIHVPLQVLSPDTGVWSDINVDPNSISYLNNNGLSFCSRYNFRANSSENSVNLRSHPVLASGVIYGTVFFGPCGRIVYVKSTFQRQDMLQTLTCLINSRRLSSVERGMANHLLEIRSVQLRNFVSMRYSTCPETFQWSSVCTADVQLVTPVPVYRRMSVLGVVSGSTYVVRGLPAVLDDSLLRHEFLSQVRICALTYIYIYVYIFICVYVYI